MVETYYRVLPVVPSDTPLPDGLFPYGYEPYVFGTRQEAEDFAREAVGHPGVAYAEVWAGDDLSTLTYIDKASI